MQSGDRVRAADTSSIPAQPDMPLLRGVSLFSNCGAGDLGYRQAGFRFDVLAELQSHRLDVALLNHPGAVGISGDLRQTLPAVIERWRHLHGDLSPALLAACPPCQGMSSARTGRGLESDADAGSRDHRNLLVMVIVEAVKLLRPRAVVVENVPAFLTRQVRHPESGIPISAAKLMIDALDNDYVASGVVTDLADYGLPQTRKRTLLTMLRRDDHATQVCTKNEIVPFPTPSHADNQIAVATALQAMKLRSLDAASKDTAIDSDDLLHRVPIWPDGQYQMVKAITPGGGGSAWQNSSCSQCGPVKVGSEDTACPKCAELLPRPVVKTAKGPRLVRGFRRTSYARMNPTRPASTITTASGRVSSDRTLHPTENRVLSMLECQLLQGMPADFNWGDSLRSKGHTEIRSMIGEAVPPLFTSQHGRILSSLLNGRRPNSCMTTTDRRLEHAARSLGLPNYTLVNGFLAHTGKSDMSLGSSE